MPGTRADAEKFCRNWAGRGDENQDTQRFWIGLLQDVLGVGDAISRLRFEVPISTAASEHVGYADVLIPSSRVIVEQKSLGIDLSKPEMRQGRMVTPAQQALAYAQGLPLSQQPRYVITCNFAELCVYDRNADALCREPLFSLALAELPKNLPAIRFLAGEGEAPVTVAQAVSVEAGEIMGRLHELAARSYDSAAALTPEAHHALSVLMTRLMFLMFCEDAGLVPTAAFADFVRHYPAADLRRALKDLFVWLDTPDTERDSFAEEWYQRLPYMNGGLFHERTEVPPLDESFRTTLLVDGCQEFDWSGVSPTVFGSIFEGALSHDHRRANGQHFTSPENIHRVIDPLFMDELNAVFEEALARPLAGGARRKALQELHHRIGTITVLDPACGSGNFLTESYLSLRQLENRILFELEDEQLSLSYEEAGEKDVLVTLANFRGIELEDFACCVARTALWIAEKQADADTAKVTRRVYQELPLTDYANVVQGDALAMDWADVVDVSELDFVIGNPPFLGASNCSATQKAAVRGLFGGGRLAGSLDYVSGWYVKTARLMRENPRIHAALVSTNSICQGEQVAPIWGTLFGEYGIRIDFAWDTFFWASEADDPAHVHCVIVGFSRGSQQGGGTLYDPATGKGEHLVSFSPYLRDLPLILLPTRSSPVCDVPKLVYGNKPSDGGNLILSDDEKDELLARWPQVAPLVRRYVGAEDFLHGRTRWCLWLLGADMALVRSCPEIVARVNRVRDLRLASSAADTRRRAEAPWEFFRTPVHDVSYLAVPRTSSERRRYLPIGYFGPETIPSDATSVVADASLYHFGILSSSVHMAWVRTVCGRLKSDYRYSGGIVYNNFPWPEPTPGQREHIETCAQAVLDARAAEPSATLAEMYDPELAWSFSALMDAHRRLDDAVANSYRTDCDWENNESVVGMLFEFYNILTEN